MKEFVMRKTIVSLASASLLLLSGIPAQAGELSADQLKELVSGKTLFVENPKNGKSWQMYHDPDGTTYKSDGNEGKWNITDDGKHCNTGVPLKCAKVVDNGDGTYNRLKPNGSTAVVWTKIVDGKDF